MNTPQVVLTVSTLGQNWAGIPGIEVTPGGRLYVSCFSGGDPPVRPVERDGLRRYGGVWVHGDFPFKRSSSAVRLMSEANLHWFPDAGVVHIPGDPHDQPRGRARSGQRRHFQRPRSEPHASDVQLASGGSRSADRRSWLPAPFTSQTPRVPRCHSLLSESHPIPRDSPATRLLSPAHSGRSSAIP